MTELEEAFLSILDNEAENPGTLVILSESEGYAGLDEISNLTIIVAKSDGDAVILRATFDLVRGGVERVGTESYHHGRRQ